MNEVHTGESTSGIKEVKEMVEGLSRQIASLTTAKSTEPHDHDSYSDQANVIGVMRKPPNYNHTPTHINLDGETTLIFRGLKDSNKMDQQLQLHQCNQFLKFLKPLSHHLYHIIRTRTTLNLDYGRMHSRISGILLTSRLSNRTEPLMNYEMR